MDFQLSDEQRLIVESVRAFVDRELVPHEREVEETGDVRPELMAALKSRAIEHGFYAVNMPEAIGAIQQSIRATILKYEPRLKNVSVRFVPSEDPLSVRFEVVARLKERLR